MTIRILEGDCRDVLRSLPAEIAHCCVTSPPYFGLRDYGCDGQMGLEATPDEFVAGMVAVFAEVRRALRDDGTLWLNIGDSYNAYNGNRGVAVGANKNHHETMPAPKRGLVTNTAKNKDLIGIPWMLAFALRADGWYLRQDIIWHKPNPMPESVTDRCTKAHEYLFLLSKSPRYYYDADAIAEPAESAGKPVKMADGWDTGAGGHGSFHRVGREKGASTGAVQGDTRNKRSVWTVPTAPFKEAHFATFPPALIEPCILAGCPEGGTVLDPFGGAGTTGLVAARLQRDAVLIELNPAYAAIARRRIHGDAPLFAEVASA